VAELVVKKFTRTRRKFQDGSKICFLLTPDNYHYSVLKDLNVKKICCFSDYSGGFGQGYASCGDSG
jgi:hypothetical protein